MPECYIYNNLGEKIAVFSTENFTGNIVIGRSSHCDICLKGHVDNTVSREHLIMEKSGFGWKLHNNSRAKMYKNAVRIDEVDLAEGDVIRFARLYLAYGRNTVPSPYDVIWDVETENGENRAVLWPGCNTIGASADNYVTVRTDDVSRVHGMFEVTGTRVTYRSMTLAGESYVRDEKVGEDPVEVHPEDEILLAETPVRLIKGMRIDFNDAPVNRQTTRAKNYVSYEAATSTGRFMYIIIALFTILVTLIVFLAFKYL